MSDLSQTLKAGDLLIIETGEYSDLMWWGPVRVLVTRTKRELVSEFKEKFVPQHSWLPESPDPGDFLPWLVKMGYAEHVDCTSWHVGSCGRFEP
jgi:hypothetical protein